MASQNSTILLNRLLCLKEKSPFMLILDSLTQSSYYIIEEFVSKQPQDIIFLSFETVNKPRYPSRFVDCSEREIQEITSDVNELLSASKVGKEGKILVIVDSLNYISNDKLASFIATITRPNISILGTYHTNCPLAQGTYGNYPAPTTFLSYIASSIFEVSNLDSESIDTEKQEENIAKLQIPISPFINMPRFKLDLTTRRKSGRSLYYSFVIDAEKHLYEQIVERKQITADESELFDDLTTFNLNTSAKEKRAKEQVELPFMQAQESLGSSGGAIVYQYEKDDDYDEDDPYEDPF